MLTAASKTCVSKDLATEVMNKKEKQLCTENTFSWANKILFELVQEARSAKTSGQIKSNQNKGLKLPSLPNKQNVRSTQVTDKRRNNEMIW